MADKNQEQKEIYVNKYDYMRHYTRCSEVQFLHNAQIAQAIKELTTHYKELAHANACDDDDEDDEEEFDSEKVDAYSQLREDELNNGISLSSLAVADKRKEDDPQIIEGIIIDQKAKDFIKSQFKISSFFFLVYLRFFFVCPVTNPIFGIDDFSSCSCSLLSLLIISRSILSLFSVSAYFMTLS